MFEASMLVKLIELCIERDKCNSPKGSEYLMDLDAEIKEHAEQFINEMNKK